jgi:hypothetical protein
MSNLKQRPLLLSLVAVIALVAGVIYYLNQPVVPPAVVAAAPAAPAEPAPNLDAAKNGTMETVTTPPKKFNGWTPDFDRPLSDFSSNPKRDPEEQQILDLAIDKSLTDRAKVEKMLGMIPSLPPDAQTLAMENATTLIPDGEYLSYRGRLLTLAKTPDMRTAVMNDSLTRGEEIRLPNLLEMMRTSSDEAEKLEIREILEAYLDKDYGPSPAQWEAPLRKWVQENTDN